MIRAAVILVAALAAWPAWAQQFPGAIPGRSWIPDPGDKEGQETTTTAPINQGATVPFQLCVVSGRTAGFAAENGHLVMGDWTGGFEVMRFSTKTGSCFTIVERGIDGLGAKGWPSGSTVTNYRPNVFEQRQDLEIFAIAGELGVDPAGPDATVVARLARMQSEIDAGGGAAPADATYLTRTPNGDLTGEFALSSLVDGLLKHTGGTPARAVPGTDYVAAEANDLSAAVTWANVPDANVPESAVTQHEGALSVDWSQLGSVPATFTPEAHTHTESEVTDLSHVVDVVSNVATARLLGRTTAGSGDSEELTAAQARTLLNVEDGATADQSAAEILSALLGVDGTGTGLDADLLDGEEATAFADAIHQHVEADITDLGDYQPLDADLTTFAGLTVAVGDVLIGATGPAWSNLPAGASGRVLTSNGAGVAPSWEPASGAPGGSDAQLQYNNGGSAFGGAPGLQYDDSAHETIMVGQVDAASDDLGAWRGPARATAADDDEYNWRLEADDDVAVDKQAGRVTWGWTDVSDAEAFALLQVRDNVATPTFQTARAANVTNPYFGIFAEAADVDFYLYSGSLPGNYWFCEDDCGATRAFVLRKQSNNDRMRIGDSAGSTFLIDPSQGYFSIGDVAPSDASATNVLQVANGTAPGSLSANVWAAYSADITPGNAAPHFRTEAGDVVALGPGTYMTVQSGAATNPGTNMGVLYFREDVDQGSGTATADCAVVARAPDGTEVLVAVVKTDAGC